MTSAADLSASRYGFLRLPATSATNSSHVHSTCFLPLRGKPDAGNPHVRFDEGEVASAKPRRGSLLYNKTIRNLAIAALFIFPGLSGFPQEVQQDETPAAKPVVEENVAFPILIGIP